MALGILKGGAVCTFDELADLVRLKESLRQKILEISNSQDLSASEATDALKKLIRELKEVDERLHKCAVSLKNPWEEDKELLSRYFPVVPD